MVNTNPIQRGKVHTRLNALSSHVYNSAYSMTQYIKLRQINQDLSKENALLRASAQLNEPDSSRIIDGFTYVPAAIINNSVNKLHNYLTIDKGLSDNVGVDMAVVSSFGIVGIVKSVSPHFARVISVLNNQLRISVKLSGSSFFGSMNWVGDNYLEVNIDEIPSHVPVAQGDTVLTSGFSAMFPPDLMVATVLEIDQASGGNFLRIKARLSNDFKKLAQVYVVKNEYADELDSLIDANEE